MKTNIEILKEVGIDTFELQREKPLLFQNILRAMNESQQQVKKNDCIADVSGSWWDSKSPLQKQNLANIIFNRNSEWKLIDEFNLTEKDIKLLYYFSNCL